MSKDESNQLGQFSRRNLWVVSLLGVLHSVGSAGVITGLAVPAVGVAGAAVELAVFGWVLTRQLAAGVRGRQLGAYLLFAALALAVLVVDAIR